MKYRIEVGIVVVILLLASCKRKELPNQEMIDLLKATERYQESPANGFSPESYVRFADSLIAARPQGVDLMPVRLRLGNALLEVGEEQKAIDVFEKMLAELSPMEFESRIIIKKDLALAYLRLGERTNCYHNHTAESCIFPISIAGVHLDKTGSQKAIEIYRELMIENSSDLESRWLLNVAYMTIGGYPDQVPPGMLLTVVNDDSLNSIKPFTDAAAYVGLNINDQAGGAIVDDFNNDNYPDIITSSWSLKEPMHYCRSNGNGTFTDISDSSWLGYLTGGLHMIQADYNNDGFKDIFVLRGAWKGDFGKEPNSLLRNNGNGTFTDVTKESGLLSAQHHPTQSGTWADFNNDGWLDLYIGNESRPGKEVHTSELYMSNRNGTFTEVAAKAGVNITDYVKGVSSGDYDNDGKSDIFVSTMTGKKYLFRNLSENGGAPSFQDVSEKSGLRTNMSLTFPGWFFDYNNDGWLDILVCSYEFSTSLGYYAGAEAAKFPAGNSGHVFLFRNKQDGTFEDVTIKAGLSKIAFAMGSNFGDIDNDGYLDFYLGTGNPLFKSLTPNKLFRNVGGERFLDVTTSARVGNLQKGHGVSFADLDNDGDEDIFIEMGGAIAGDSYESSLYLNPGQNANHWINLVLEGTASNKAAIGARVKVTFKENGIERSVYREINSGGSFGSNPLRQHIGIGKAESIDRIEITWPVTGNKQTFTNPPLDVNMKITEDSEKFSTYTLARIDFMKSRTGLIPCKPVK